MVEFVSQTKACIVYNRLLRLIEIQFYRPRQFELGTTVFLHFFFPVQLSSM
jgi:hypothetical protein